jgi:hypothetical protein
MAEGGRQGRALKNCPGGNFSEGARLPRRAEGRRGHESGDWGKSSDGRGQEDGGRQRAACFAKATQAERGLKDLETGPNVKNLPSSPPAGGAGGSGGFFTCYTTRRL